MKFVEKFLLIISVLSLIIGAGLIIQACGDTNLIVSPVSTTSGSGRINIIQTT